MQDKLPVINIKPFVDIVGQDFYSERNHGAELKIRVVLDDAGLCSRLFLRGDVIRVVFEKPLMPLEHVMPVHQGQAGKFNPPIDPAFLTGIERDRDIQGMTTGFAAYGGCNCDTGGTTAHNNNLMMFRFSYALTRRSLFQDVLQSINPVNYK